MEEKTNSGMKDKEIAERKHRIWLEINKLIERSTMSEKNKQTLICFRDQLVGQGFSFVRIKLYLSLARTIAQMGGKDLQDYTKADVDAVMTKIRLCGRYKPASINYFVTTFKAMFRFIDCMDGGEQSPRTKHLKLKKPQNSPKRENLVTGSEADKLIAGAVTMKNGALWSSMIALQWESAMRPSELCGILLKHMKKEPWGFAITVDGMSGQRQVYSLRSAPLIERWLAFHADGGNPDAPLFYLRNNGKIGPVGHAAYSRCIGRLSRKILGRRVQPLYLRHSAIAKYINEGLPRCVVQKLAGYVPGSSRKSVYRHLPNNC